MSLDAKGAAALALHRFGLGPRAGSIAAIASDPRGALLAELDKPGIGQIVNPELLSAAQATRAVFNFRQERQARLIAQRKDEEERKEAGMSMESMEGQANAAQIPAAEAVPQQNFQREVKARFDAALAPEIGFVERLVWFWSNHFCVSADVTISMTGAYEREAIRPHVLGRFADMLLASAGHPAMLFYLDNSRSIGPKSVAGSRQQHRPEREPRARDFRAAYARRALGLHPGRRHQLRQGADRLDHSLRWRPIRSAAASSCSIRACTSRVRRPSSARSTRSQASSRAGRCSPISRAIRRRPRMLRASSRGISAPTSRRIR